MPAIALGQSDYHRPDLPQLRLVNRFYETAPTTQEQVALFPRPGHALFATVTASSIIDVFRQPGTLDGLIMAVTANFIYALNASGAVVGTTPVLNLASRVSMASGLSGVLYLTDGAQLLRCTVTQGESVITVTAVPFPDSALCSWVAYLNGYFLFGRTDSHRVYFLPPGETVIDGLDFFSAEVAPDNLVGGYVLGDELWLMGESTVEVHTPTGVADLPFQRSIGRPTDYSLASRDCVEKIDNSLFFVSADRVVYRTAGLPQRISDHGIEEHLAASGHEHGVAASDLQSWQYAYQGHVFYVLNVGDDHTFAYDVSTQRWHRMTSHGSDAFKCRVSCPLGDGRWLIGDSETGSLYTVGGDDDNGDPIVKVAAGVFETAPSVCNNIVLECTVGEAADLLADPIMEARLSLDLGKTWTDWFSQSLGRLGEYYKLVHWRRWGLVKRTVLVEFRDSNAVNTIIRRAGYNEVTL